jgi:nucleoid-associated protein YgaU
MQRDYKIGLVSGLVLAMAAVLWVATRPSLNPEAGMFRPSQATARDAGPAPADRVPARTGRDNSPAEDASLGSILNSPPGNSDSPTPKPSSPTDAPQPAMHSPQSGSVPDLTIYEKAEKIKTTRFHILRKEETLSAVSQQYYGTPNNWQKILNANKNVIKDANKLQPGTKLIIPE